MDPATAVVIAAVIAAIASIVNTALNLWDRSKVKETHTAVTQNGGGNNPPTVLDKLAMISTKVSLLDCKLDNHIAQHDKESA